MKAPAAPELALTLAALAFVSACLGCQHQTCESYQAEWNKQHRQMVVQMMRQGIADQIERDRIEKVRQLDERGESAACKAEIDTVTKNVEAFGRQ